MSNQFLRKLNLIVSAGSNGLDLSQFRVTFHTQQMDEASPNTAIIKVYNLKDSDAKSIQNEYQNVTLQAGYQNGNYGIIFQGQIMQVRRGRESATDSFVEIMTADSDQVWNNCHLNMTLAAGSTALQRYNAIVSNMAPYQVTSDSAAAANMSATGGVIPRGKVLFGLAARHMNDLAASQNVSWSIQNGKVVVIPRQGYLPGTVVKINSRTGLIGIPEATNNGIEVTCLLNPYLKIGTRIQLNQAELNTTTVKQQGFPTYTSVNFPANTTDDGIYRILVVEHEGDTRGTNWYSKLVCLSLDSSSGTTNG